MSRLDGMISNGIRRGLHDGLLGGNNQWLLLGALAIVARVVLNMARKSAVVAYHEELAPGDAITITHFTLESPPAD